MIRQGEETAHSWFLGIHTFTDALYSMILKLKWGKSFQALLAGGSSILSISSLHIILAGQKKIKNAN